MPPDYVRKTLEFLDSNWNSGYSSGYGENYGTGFKKPIMYDGRDGRIYRGGGYTGERLVDHDLTDGNAIKVGGQPSVSKEPEGLAWQFDRVESGVRIRIEAAHGGRNDWGGIDAAVWFGGLVDEAQRTLEVERKRPLPGYYRLEVRSRDNESSNYGDYYRSDLVAYYVGLEQLP